MSAVKNQTAVTLKLGIKMPKGNYLTHKLLLTTRPKTTKKCI